MTALIRPIQPSDRDEWQRLRDALWPHENEEHAQAIDIFLAAPPVDHKTLV